jgi:HSP90 family molecular chaperone
LFSNLTELTRFVSDSKTVSDEEYETFYKSFFKDYEAPLAWQHFSGDFGSGVSFKAILFIPSKLLVKINIYGSGSWR